MRGDTTNGWTRLSGTRITDDRLPPAPARCLSMSGPAGARVDLPVRAPIRDSQAATRIEDAWPDFPRPIQR
jgi:hypothetical protein